jgi:CO/xanthine dehydrogenase FAD-binding subunit
MIPSSFDYLAPRTLDEAVTVLTAHAGDAKILDGETLYFCCPHCKARFAKARA